MSEEEEPPPCDHSWGPWIPIVGRSGRVESEVRMCTKCPAQENR